MAKALVIAAPASGSGKTLITLGLIRALRNLGLKVRSAKVGPDYIDGRFQEVASGHPCFNLDLWAMGKQSCRVLLARLAQGADIVIIEGVMGLFDGPQNAPGSTADLAVALGLPVVLVVDASHQSQSAAAVVHGFATFRQDVTIAGIILNRVKSDRHAQLLTDAVKGGPPLLGTMRHSDSLHWPSRHLGLLQAQENQELDAFIEGAASGVARETNLDKLFQIGTDFTNQSTENELTIPPPGQRIALAQDIAFAFVYPHLIAGWRAAGAAILPFSPLNDEAPADDADFLFLPGGYPELHAGALAANATFLEGLRRFHGPIYGECGGYMVLGRGLVDAQGQRHAMAGLLPLETSFTERKLHLGYRQLTMRHGPFPKNLRGHEFHYSTATREGPGENLFEAATAAGDPLPPMGLRAGKVMGSYAHVIARDPQ